MKGKLHIKLLLLSENWSDKSVYSWISCLKRSRVQEVSVAWATHYYTVQQVTFEVSFFMI